MTETLDRLSALLANLDELEQDRDEIRAQIRELEEAMRSVLKVESVLSDFYIKANTGNAYSALEQEKENREDAIDRLYEDIEATRKAIEELKQEKEL